MRRSGLEDICKWLTQAAAKDGQVAQPPSDQLPRKKRKLTTPFRCTEPVEELPLNLSSKCQSFAAAEEDDCPLDLSKPDVSISGANTVLTAESPDEGKLNNKTERALNGNKTHKSKTALFKGKLSSDVYQDVSGEVDLTSEGLVPLLAGRDAEVYIQRFAGFEQCGMDACRVSNLREHFHCRECSRTMARREEMIRHVKWHKKREESLALGFMRYSPADECQQSSCQYNRKQTHYHCVQTACDKVYISTSDVQIHANFHRKDAAIMKQGFQRFRATEVCPDSSCPFNMERTTHFHCLRPSCSFSFKNKADMEKHKNHHGKNEEFAKDGFRKYMKHEECDFASCKFSRMMNHIHCIRQNCDFVVHSSSQILSHCRKHERRKDDVQSTSSLLPSNNNQVSFPSLYGQISGMEDNVSPTPQLPSARTSLENYLPAWALQASCMTETFKAEGHCNSSESESEQMRVEITDNENDNSVLSEPDETSETSKQAAEVIPFELCVSTLTKETLDELEGIRMNIIRSLDSTDKENLFQRYIKRFTANDPCFPLCGMLFKDHYHCQANGCNALFKSKEKVRDHVRVHYLDEEYLKTLFCQHSEDHTDCTVTTYHVHCKYCAVFLTPDGSLFTYYHHVRMHEVSIQVVRGKQKKAADVSRFGMDTANIFQSFKRKRGRPPKGQSLSQDLVVPMPNLEVNPDALQDDGRIPAITKLMLEASPGNFLCGFKFISAQTDCFDDRCVFSGQEHYHCVRPRCHSVTLSISEVNLHRSSFHSHVRIEDGFEFFDRYVDCRRPGCPRTRVSSHFHCTRKNCNYQFVRYNTMDAHRAKHEEVPGDFVSEEPVFQQQGFYPPPPLHPLPFPMPAMIYSSEVSCGRQMCLLKSQVHVHCSFPSCDQAFSDGSKLQSHSCQQATSPLPYLFPKPDSFLSSQSDMFSAFSAIDDCGSPDCEYRFSTQHFHCALCAYVCKDAGKLDQHTLRHANAFLASQGGFSMPMA